MHILFCHDTYYSKKRDGTVLSYGAFPYELWQARFLPHFDTMTVIGRKKKLGPQETGVLEVSSGKNVEHILLPNIHAPIKRLTKMGRMYKKIKEQVERADAVVIRGPVELGMLAAKAARETGTPYAIEMNGCAHDTVYYTKTIFNRIYAPIRYQRTQRMVRHADAVMYMTEKFLQTRYPTRGLAAHASHVEIPAMPDYVLQARQKRIDASRDSNHPLIFGLIGNFNNGLKGTDVALRALAQVNTKRGKSDDIPDFRFKVLGQGSPAQWSALIGELGLEGKVEFCGSVPRGQAVLDWLDTVDIYLQPSYHEGLPRALIEAMSRGCAALASDAGGTQELLPADYIHKRGNAAELAAQIETVLPHNVRQAAAQQNFEVAKDYSKDVLRPRREAFWQDFADYVSQRDKAA